MKYFLLLNLISASAFAQSQTALETYFSTARQIREIHRKLGVNSVVQTINTTLTEVRNETVTEKFANKHSSSIGGSGSGLFGLLFSGSFGSSNESSSKWDVTKVLVQNPEEVATFNHRVRSELSGLQSQMLQYLDKNESDLIRLKELCVVNLAQAFQLMQDPKFQQATDPRFLQELATTARIATELTFHGQQVVTRCVQTNFAARVREGESKSNQNAGFRLLFLDFSASSSSYNYSYWEQVPHSDKSCSSSTNQISITPENTVFFVNLSYLDRMVEGWLKAVNVARLAVKDQVYYPTWGSPYYR